MTGIIHKFELINSKSFKLPRCPVSGNIATHLATIKWGMREFVYFRLDLTGQTYIEEIILKPTAYNGKITAKYERVEDDNLWRDLAEFLKKHGLTNMSLAYHNPYK